MDVDQEIFNLYKDKALAWTSIKYVFVSTLLIAFVGVLLPSVLPLFFASESKVEEPTITITNLLNSIKFLLLVTAIVSVFVWSYVDAKYQEYKKDYTMIMVSCLVDAKLTNEGHETDLDLDSTINKIVSMTLFNYESVLQIIEERYNITTISKITSKAPNH